jgi:leader peptidase (prepilin peptidase) / N-methyltransferase
VLVVGLWLLVGWLVGGALAVLAVILPAKEPRPTAPCPADCRSPRARLRLALWGYGARKCPTCGFRRREPWPLPEVASAAVFATLAWRFGWGAPLLVYSVLGAILVLVVFVDVRYRLIPDALTLPFTLAALAVSPFTLGPARAALGAVIAGGIFFGLYVLARLIYRRSGALGLGDVKLALLIGAVVGPPAALAVIVYSALAGGAMAIALIASGRSRRYAMPYGPNLALGALAAILLDPSIWR